MRRNGGIIGPLVSFNLGENISGVYDTYDVYNYKKDDVWSYTPSVSLTESSTSINETSNFILTINVEAQGFNNGDTLYWTVNGISGTVESSDFSSGFTGSFTLSGDVSLATGVIEIIISTDGTPDGTDVFEVQVRTDSVSGDIIATSQAITISDTSTEPPQGEDIRSSFYAISEFVNNDSASDTSSNYSVSEVQQDYTGSGRLYLIHKAGAQEASYFYDVPIACIQVLNPSGTVINEQWWFGNNDNRGWQTHTSEHDFGPEGSGINITPDQAASNYSYQSILTGSTADRFNLASNTSSNDTGAVDGIPEPTAPMTLGEKTMPQGSGTYYIYREMSGGTNEFCALCRSPVRNWQGGEIIRIAYIIGNRPSLTAYDPNDTLHVGIA